VDTAPDESQPSEPPPEKKAPLEPRF
jgi:hypothetical protein